MLFLAKSRKNVGYPGSGSTPDLAPLRIVLANAYEINGAAFFVVDALNLRGRARF